MKNKLVENISKKAGDAIDSEKNRFIRKLTDRRAIVTIGLSLIYTWAMFFGQPKVRELAPPIFMAVMIAIMAFTLRKTEKANKMISAQKEELTKQKAVLEEKNKEIVDSINYAKRLQEAILPPMSLIKQFFADSFVLYKPKDIVAGDFYWMEKSEDVVLIAAADCTGHGVPGALVSIVCSNALNRAVKEFHITEPGKILDKVRELVLETFERSESNVQDGMDISLCAIKADPQTAHPRPFPKGREESHESKVFPKGEDLGGATIDVQWSGANNSLWYVRNGSLMEVTADKQPIGKNDNPKPFTTHNLKLQKGDALYFFSDGYADQFGGTKGKKFKSGQMQELLIANAAKPMEEQRTVLEKTLNEWKGNLEQVDDILVIGIRI